MKAIYFDNEGHVIHYDVSAPNPTTAIFLSEAPHPGPQFRLVYELKGSIMSGQFQMRMSGQNEWKSYLEWSGANSYPVSVYEISGYKLKLVREVVSQADGVRMIQAWDDVIFAIHPHITSTAVSIVHTNKPEMVDDVVFNPQELIPFDAAVSVVVVQGVPFELVPLIVDAHDRAHSTGSLASISERPIETGSRIQADKWKQYSQLRTEGEIGGPERMASLICTLDGDHVAMSIFDQHIIVDNVPAALRDTQRATGCFIEGASDRFLVLGVAYLDIPLSVTGTFSEDLFVHDQSRNLWNQTHIEGMPPDYRLFGSWLAQTIEQANPQHQIGPGRENERNLRTDRLPDVQALYTWGIDRRLLRPGILVLQNLDDARKLRIETGQEDSEILWAGADSVVYRVNDTIYQAKIVGDKFDSPVQLVKDDDVPEVHWIFWAE